MTDHHKGLLITVFGVITLSPDSLLVRLIDSDPWTLLFWRGVLLAIGLMVMTLVLYRRRAGTAIRAAVGKSGLMASMLFTVSTLGFVNALHLTTVANTLLILSSSPLFAALFSRIFLREMITPRTWAAIILAMVAVMIIITGSLGSGNLTGDICALFAAAGLAGNLVVVRHSRHVSMIPATALGSIIAAVVVLPLATPMAISAAQAGWLLFLCLLLLPVAFGSITLGPRYLTAPEVSLIMLLEAALGPLWVWLVIGEEPAATTLLGGGLLLITIVGHATLGLSFSRRATLG